jgi:hypothetical protein
LTACSLSRGYAAWVTYEDSNVDAEPDLARLTTLLDQAELALVVKGSHFDARRRKASHVLARAGDRSALAELRSALRCVPRTQRLALMTPGEPTIALFGADRQYLAAITVVGSGHVRSHGLLEGDALLAEPERLIRWLAVIVGSDHGA